MNTEAEPKPVAFVTRSQWNPILLSVSTVNGEFVAVEEADSSPQLRITAQDGALTLSAAGIETRLHVYDPDWFLTDAAPLARFPLVFDREDDHIHHTPIAGMTHVSTLAGCDFYRVNAA